MGYMGGTWSDVHGAGSQRSDPKEGDPEDWPTGRGPQGDAVRIYNFVRLVRDVDGGSVAPTPTAEATPTATRTLEPPTAVAPTATPDGDHSVFMPFAER